MSNNNQNNQNKKSEKRSENLSVIPKRPNQIPTIPKKGKGK